MALSPRLHGLGRYPAIGRKGRLLIAALAVLATLLLVRSNRAAATPPGPALPVRYTGVNLAGGEFAGKHLPGRYGFDYSYPDRRAAAPFVAAGMTAVRVPVRWERIQPVGGGPLDEFGIARLDTSIAALGGFRLIIIDVHNYARYNRARLDQPDSPALLADLWRRLSERYGANQRVAFGLMNEPHDIDASVWRKAAEAAVVAIRRTGARNLVLVPGTRWTGAHSWTAGGTSSNASALSSFRDPGNNMAFELHQYLDDNSSGTAKTCVDPERAAARLADATEWLRQQHARAFLAEFGTSADPQCLAGLDAILTAADRASDVWLGWTYWAAGTRWKDYPYDVQPKGEAIAPQMHVLLRHIPRPAAAG